MPPQEPETEERRIRRLISSYLLCRAFEQRFTPAHATILREAASVISGPASLEQLVHGDVYEEEAPLAVETRREVVAVAVMELEATIARLKEMV